VNWAIVGNRIFFSFPTVVLHVTSGGGSPPVQDLLLFAKHLFVATMVGIGRP